MKKRFKGSTEHFCGWCQCSCCREGPKLCISLATSLARANRKTCCEFLNITFALGEKHSLALLGSDQRQWSCIPFAFCFVQCLPSIFSGIYHVPQHISEVPSLALPALFELLCQIKIAVYASKVCSLSWSPHGQITLPHFVISNKGMLIWFQTVDID